MKLAIIVAALALSGCQTPVEQLTYTQKRELISEMVDRCIEQGIPVNSPEMTPCAESELHREIALREQGQQTRMALGAAMGNMGAQMQRNAATYQRPVTCRSTPSSTWVGGPVSRVRTTCY